MPDPTRLCVVARGAGYVVSARDPQSWNAVEAVPVTDVRAIPAAGVVVFASLTDLVAYGAEGRRWRTQRLAWDGLKITRVTDSSIAGDYADIGSDEIRHFEVDLATGTHRGGVE